VYHLIQAHLKGFWSYKMPGPHDQFGATRIIALQVHGNQAFDHIAFALPDFGHIDRNETRRCPKLCGVTHQICDLGAPDLILTRETIGVRAGAAYPSAFHDGSMSPKLRQIEAA
jgi:hypothetical protein